MICESSRNSQNGAAFIMVEEDYLDFSETTENLFKTMESIRDFVQCRTNIFLQRKEKHQQILDSQMVKLDNERKEYIKKSEAVMNEMGEAKAQLMQIEHSYFSVRNKLNLDKQTQKALEERIKQLQQESKQKNAKFYRTSELYSTVLGWYSEALNMSVNLDPSDSKILTVTFKECRKDFRGYPFIKLEMLENDQFQVIKIHPGSEDDDIMKQNIPSSEILLFLHKFRKQFLSEN